MNASEDGFWGWTVGLLIILAGEVAYRLTPRLGWLKLDHEQARLLNLPPRPGHGRAWEIWRVEWLWWFWPFAYRETDA